MSKKKKKKKVCSFFETSTRAVAALAGCCHSPSQRDFLYCAKTALVNASFNFRHILAVNNLDAVTLSVGGSFARLNGKANAARLSPFICKQTKNVV